MDQELGNSSAFSCPSREVERALGWVSISLAVVVLVLLSMVYRRARLCSGVCWNIPGIVTPVDLLTHSSNRAIHLLLFAALSGDILIALYQQHIHIYTGDNPYVAIFIHTVITPIITVLEVCVKFFPLFASVDTPLALLGHTAGLIYLPFLLSVVIYRDVAVACVITSFSLQQNVLAGLYIGARLPSYIAFLLILVWFVFALIRDAVYINRQGFTQAMESLQGVNRSYEYYKKCVKHSLRPAGVRALDSRLYRHCCLCPCLSSPRRLPLRLSGAVTVASLILYQLCLLTGGGLLYATTLLNNLVMMNKQEIINYLLRNFQIDFDFANQLYTVASNTVKFLMFVLPFSPVISTVLCLLLLAHLTISVYKSLQSAGRGDLKMSDRFPAFQLAASLRYAGYQIAFVVSAFIAYTLVLWTLGLIGVAFYIGFQYYSDYCWLIIATVLIPVGWIAVLVSAQVAACKLLFLKPGGGKFIVINNKKIFHWFGFLLFVYNTIVGLFTAILRVLISAILGLVLMLRLDRVILMKGFEILDIGHNAYKGFLHVDLSYNNPVVHVFVRLLVETTAGAQSHASVHAPAAAYSAKVVNGPDKDYAYNAEEHSLLPLGHNSQKTFRQSSASEGVSSDDAKQSRRMRNKWLVAYTMIRNPSVRRAHCPTVSQS